MSNKNIASYQQASWADWTNPPEILHFTTNRLVRCRSSLRVERSNPGAILSGLLRRSATPQ
ncbi:MAG: hypothetical protein LBT00_13015 [Spirochaetaceae bacterium]|nr:hypothetical protein [Spirochaetaceae bacterium]